VVILEYNKIICSTNNGCVDGSTKITMNQITNFFSLLLMLLPRERLFVIFSINTTYTKRWILSTPIYYQPINHVFDFHLPDHVVMHMTKSIVPSIETLGVVLLARTRRKTCIFDCSLRLNFSCKKLFAIKIFLVA